MLFLPPNVQVDFFSLPSLTPPSFQDFGAEVFKTLSFAVRNELASHISGEKQWASQDCSGCSNSIWGAVGHQCMCLCQALQQGQGLEGTGGVVLPCCWFMYQLHWWGLASRSAHQHQGLGWSTWDKKVGNQCRCKYLYGH